MIEIYDTTLRDGTQGEGVSFTLEDKLRIARRLDEFGIHYVEGGWPGSNPKDIAFFEAVRGEKLKQAKIAAFGSTRHARNRASEDLNIQTLEKAETEVVTIFGKTWDLHVTHALRVSLDDNLDMIRDSVAYLVSTGRKVIYDAEHYFDGYAANPEYALATCRAAVEAGASLVVLCDTNGGALPGQIAERTKAALSALGAPVGIHAHNDGGLGVANSLAAVETGAVHIQGTMNGYGERCGNADLTAIIPNLILKMNLDCIPNENLPLLTELSYYVSELGNLTPNDRAPFVGRSAFAHKGGIHVSAVQRLASTYEHIDPTLVGNDRRVLISELSGRSNVDFKAAELGVTLEKGADETRRILEKVKDRENQGYIYEGADGSFEILVKKELGRHREFFKLDGYRVIIEKRGHDSAPVSEATVRVYIQGEREYMAAESEGPVEALDHALRKALEKAYPELASVRLTDFKVRVLDAKEATAAKVRVLIESTDGHQQWGTIGVSENIIEASWQALVDSIDYKLLKDEDARNAAAAQSGAAPVGRTAPAATTTPTTA